MARGRMLATTIADDKRFNALPVDAALVYLMAIPQLDRDGLILGEPVLLWGQVCRRRNDLMPRMADIIAAWVTSGLVTAYKTDDDDTVLHFAGFQKNQAMTHYGREAASRFPCPPGFIRTNKGLVPDGVQPSIDEQLDQLRTNSGLTPDEVQPNVIEGNVIEINEIPSPADAVPVAPKTFAEEFSDVQAELKVDGSNKAAILRGWYIRCFGEGGAPDYSYIGKVAKQVGGAGHLAALFMQLASRPPNGDVLAYIVATHKGKNGNGTGNGYYSTTEGYTMGTFVESEK